MRFTRNQFIALSKRYKYGDELVLPYPERSTRGLQLEQMAASLSAQKLAIVVSPALDLGVHHLLDNDGHNSYRALHHEVAACLLFPSKPIEYWRSPQRLNLGVAEAVSLLVNPPLNLLENFTSKVRGAYIGDGMEQHSTVKELAALGLTHATSLPDGFWLGANDPAARYELSASECATYFEQLCTAFEDRTVGKAQIVQLISLAANGHPQWTQEHQWRISSVLGGYPKSAADLELERAIFEAREASETTEAAKPKN